MRRAGVHVRSQSSQRVCAHSYAHAFMLYLLRITHNLAQSRCVFAVRVCFMLYHAHAHSRGCAYGIAYQSENLRRKA
eukprot:5103784-Pleurochrysis_carterae.AAC.2